MLQTNDLKRLLGRLRKRVRPRLHHRTLFRLAHVRRCDPNVQTHQQNPVHNSRLCSFVFVHVCVYTLIVCCCWYGKLWTTASRTAVPLSGAAHPPSGVAPRSRTCAAHLRSSPRSQTPLSALLHLLLLWSLCLQQRQPWQRWRKPSRSMRCPPRSFRLLFPPSSLSSFFFVVGKGEETIHRVVCLFCLFSSGCLVCVWMDERMEAVEETRVRGRGPYSRSSALCGRARQSGRERGWQPAFWSCRPQQVWTLHA